jgi:O-antigen ligase
VLAAGLAVNLSGASWFAVAAVLVCMAAWRGHKVFIPVFAALLVAQIVVLPNLPRENDVAHFKSLALYDGGGTINRRYPEWQAAYDMTLNHQWLGVGMGNYQKHIGQYYSSFARPTGPTEPDIQNLYLVLAASAGFPALLLFIVLLSGALRDARRGAAHGAAGLGLGAGGAILAFAVTAVWHPLLVRGIGLPLVFVLALARLSAQEKKPDGN